MTKQITELNKLNDKLINEEKKLKTKLKEQETEINNLKKNLKKKMNDNNNFERLYIFKGSSFQYISNDKNIKKIRGYNDNSGSINYNMSLQEKDKEKDKEKSNSSQYKNNSINKIYSKTNLLYNVSSNNSSKNRMNKNKTQNYYNYMNKIQKNITNILDFFHEQNECYSPCNLIVSSSFKKENQLKSSSKESSPSSHNKLKYSSINSNCNRNNNQVMINVNTNIINSNGSIEKFKLYKKIKDYHKLDKKLKEMTRNIIPKSIKRTLSAFQNRRNSSPNFYDNNRHYSNINKHINKNSNNSKKRKNITPNKNKQLNSADIKKYNNISVHINGKKSINNFRKKTPHRLIAQRKEITPNLKVNHYLCSSSNSNTKPQTKDNLRKNNNNCNQNRIIKKASLSNNSTNIVSNSNSNFNSNTLIKNHTKMQSLINNHNNNNFTNFKKIKTNKIVDGILSNALVIANIKNKSGSNTINSSMSNHSSLRKFIFTRCNSTNVHGKY